MCDAVCLAVDAVVVVVVVEAVSVSVCRFCVSPCFRSYFFLINEKLIKWKKMSIEKNCSLYLWKKHKGKRKKEKALIVHQTRLHLTSVGRP